MATQDEEGLIGEFEALARIAGIEVPADRRDAMIASYRDLRAMTALLHTELPPAVESANVFAAGAFRPARRAPGNDLRDD